MPAASATQLMPKASHDIRITGLTGLTEIDPSTDLCAAVLDACGRQSLTLQDSDVVVVTQKVISKNEGRLVRLSEVEASEKAIRFAQKWDKDARVVELALREARRVVRMERGVLITETEHGLVCANSGVDASNVGTDEAVTLLPRDPDGSAAALRRSLQAKTGATLAVIVTDTFGRPWREGVTNVAIGIAGMSPFVDYRGREDAEGRNLSSTVIAVADEIAAAAELVMGKLDRVPVAILRGYDFEVASEESFGETGARAMVRAAERDLFR